MKRSSLSNEQRKVLEELIARHGLIVTTQDIFARLPQATIESKHRLVRQLREAGWLVRVKNGLYQIAELGSLGSLSLSRLTVAHLLLPESYISFQAALQYHGLFDQSLQSISSISLVQRATVQLEGTAYRYIKTKPPYFFGFRSHAMNGCKVQIAEPEKAIIDLMQFHRTGTTVDLVVETLRDSRHRLQLDQLAVWAERAPLAVQRVLGFLLAAVGIPAPELAAAAQRSKSITRLTPESNQYNSVWRLYYDPYFVAGAVGV